MSAGIPDACLGEVSDTHGMWMDAVLRVASHYRIATSPERVRLDVAWTAQPDRLRVLARSAGLSIREAEVRPELFSQLRLPLVAEFNNGEIGVIERETSDGFGVVLSGDKGLETPLSRQALIESLRRVFILRPVSSRPDRRIDDYIAPWRPDWLRSIVLADLKPYRAVMMASLVTNILALAGVIFSMQVYDRVIPAQSMNTLWVLFIGVMLASFFGLLMRVVRGRITDLAGKAADLRISDRVFGHALRVRNTARPRSTGTFISQIRELEHVREMITSTTVSAIANVPFFLLFCLLFYKITGALVWCPLVAVILMVTPGILAQKRLRRLAETNTRETALRSAMLVETIQGLDDIKSLQAEPRFQTLWNHYNETTAGSAMALRDLVNRLSSWAQTVQGGVFAVVVFFGAPQVMAGDMSTGALVAASILSSRMLAPLASVTQILNRWQQAQVARKALDDLMALPVDAHEQDQPIHKPALEGRFELTESVFGHDPRTPALKVDRMHIKPGERIAILGRNGAGKSTLLSGLAGLLEPLSGEIRIDDVVMGLIDPTDVRRDIGLLGQGARLFHGTLRENLTLGAPAATDEMILNLLGRMGMADFVQRLPDGLDHLVQEGGLGLSGGQKQALLLARLLLRNPKVLLLDEPTASFDEVSEAAIIEMLALLDPDISVIVATHRPALLRLVNRLIVVSNGKIVMDGPKDQVLAQLRSGKAAG